MAASEREIFVNGDGSLQFIYDDELADVFSGESSSTKRVSHVEPLRDGWVADMSPVGGGYLYADGECDDPECDEHAPFKTRQAALDAEIEWLRASMAEKKLEVK